MLIFLFDVIKITHVQSSDVTSFQFTNLLKWSPILTNTSCQLPKQGSFELTSRISCIRQLYLSSFGFNPLHSLRR